MIDYKFNEGELIAEFKNYIDSTYGTHYSRSKFQASEFIFDTGHGVGFTIGNILKYAQRYGRKGTRADARKDLMKIMHYTLLALHVHDENEQFETTIDEEFPRENFRDPFAPVDLSDSSVSCEPCADAVDPEAAAIAAVAARMGPSKEPSLASKLAASKGVALQPGELDYTYNPLRPSEINSGTDITAPVATQDSSINETLAEIARLAQEADEIDQDYKADTNDKES